jgi:hypothetical protein
VATLKKSSIIGLVVVVSFLVVIAVVVQGLRYEIDLSSSQTETEQHSLIVIGVSPPLQLILVVSFIVLAAAVIVVLVNRYWG